MKFSILLGLLCLGCASKATRVPSAAPRVSSWTTAVGGSKKDAVFNLAERPQGGFWGVGKTESVDGDLRGTKSGRGQDAWLFTLSADGRLESGRAWGGSAMDVFAAVAATGDGGAVVVGSTASMDGDASSRPRRSKDLDIWVLKFDRDGKLEWQKFFGGSADDFGMAVLPTADGGYLVGADSMSADGDTGFRNGGRGHHGCHGGHRDFLILKLDGKGELQWTRSFGGSNHEYLSNLVATSDGNFAAAGRTESFDGDIKTPLGEYDAWAIKFSPNGDLLWETTLGGEMWDWGSNVVATPDGGVAVSGYTFSWDRDGAGNHGDYDYFLVRLDAKGRRLWSRVYGGSLDDFAQGLVALSDGTFVITGGSVSKDGDVPENRGSFDLWAIRVSSRGDLLWSRTYGGSAYDIAAPGGSDYYMASPGGAMIPTRDGGVAIAGASKSRDGDVIGAHGGYDAWVVKWSPAEWAAGSVVAKRGQVTPLRPNPPSRLPAPQRAPDIEWSRTYGGSGKDAPLDSPQALAKNGRGGYIMIGTSESSDHGLRNRGGSDVLVVNVDERGETIWKKTYGGSGNDVGAAIATVKDGGFIFAATTDSKDGDVGVNKGMTDIWVVRLDEQGRILWKKILGGSSAEHATTLVATRDGGFLVGGSSYSRDGDVRDHVCGYDDWVVKLAADGRIEWSRSLGGASNDYLIQLVESPNGDIGLIGRTESTDRDAVGNHGMYDYLLTVLDSRGNKRWSRTYGGIDWEWGNSLVATADGGFLLNGYSYTFDDFEQGQVKCNHGEFDYWVVKVDARGALQWQQCFGGSNYELGYGVIQTRDGGYAVIGGSPSNDGQVSGNHGGWDAWLVKMDARGRLLWQKAMGGGGYDVGYALVEADDGGLVVLAETFSNDGDVGPTAGAEDMWLVKLKPENGY